MEALSAGRFHKTLQLQLVQERPDKLRRLDHESPWDRGIRVKVHNDAVRTVQSIPFRSPRMQLQHAHLNEPDDSRQRVGDHVPGHTMFF